MIPVSDIPNVLLFCHSKLFCISCLRSEFRCLCALFQNILTIQQGESYYFSFLENLCTLHKKYQGYKSSMWQFLHWTRKFFCSTVTMELPCLLMIFYWECRYRCNYLFNINLNNRSWGLFWPRRNKTRHYFLIGWTYSFVFHNILYANAPKHPKRYDGVRCDPKTYVGVKKDPRTCLTWLFFGPVIRVKLLWSREIDMILNLSISNW